MKKINFIILSTFLFLVGCSTMGTRVEDQKSLFADASKSFNHKEFKKAKMIFKQFLFKTDRGSKFYKANRFTAIDSIVEINLKHSKSPSDNIQFLNSVIKNISLNESEDDSVHEWLGVSQRWNKVLSEEKKSLKGESLYELGLRYYEIGMKKVLYPADTSGNADFYISSRYLMNYVFRHDKASNIGKALFMLGNIKVRTLIDDEYWSENYYLKEVIRRFPHSELASRAYLVLEESIIGGYTGSAGVSIPQSQKVMLIKYKKLSQRK